MYIGSSDALKLYKLELASGKVTWEFNTGGWSWAKPLLHDGVIYIGVASASPYWQELPQQGLYAVDASSGQMLWHYRSKTTDHFAKGIISQPALTHENLMVTGLDGVIRAFHLPDK